MHLTPIVAVHQRKDLRVFGLCDGNECVSAAECLDNRLNAPSILEEACMPFDCIPILGRSFLSIPLLSGPLLRT